MKTKMLVISLIIFSVIVMLKIVLKQRIKLRMLVNNDLLIQIKVGLFQYFNITNKRELSRNAFTELSKMVKNPVSSIWKSKRITNFLKNEKPYLLEILKAFSLKKVTFTPCIRFHDNDARWLLYSWWANIYVHNLLNELFDDGFVDEYYQITIDFEAKTTLKFDLLFDITIEKLLVVMIKNCDTLFNMIKLKRENKKNDEQSNY